MLPEANVIKCLIVDTICFVGVFYELVDRESGVVRLNNCVRYFRGGDHWVGVHDSVRILLPDLGDEEGSHPWPGATSQRVGQLETLQAVAPLRLLPERLEVKNTSNIRVLKCITSNNTWTMRRIGWKWDELPYLTTSRTESTNSAPALDLWGYEHEQVKIFEQDLWDDERRGKWWGHALTNTSKNQHQHL